MEQDATRGKCRHENRLGSGLIERARVAWSRVLVVLIGLMGAVSCDSVAPPGMSSTENPSNSVLVADASRTSTSVSIVGADTAIVVLDAGASIPSDDSLQIQWQIDGVAAGTERITEVELGPGVYEVNLTIANQGGQVASDTLTLTVAQVAENEVLLAIGVSGGGVTEPPPGETRHESGATIRLRAIPAPGFTFVGWTGDLETTDSSVVVTLIDDLFVTAEFQSLDATGVPRFFLPWAAQRTRRVGQGNNGMFSHTDAFAWDFSMRVGTPILAVAAGRVVEVIEENQRDENASVPVSDRDFANIVRLDHGRGLQTAYVHLDFQGAMVEVGQDVVRGQVIGYSGNTGFSTGPHLHYEVLDVNTTSTPSGFFEVDRKDGVAIEGEQVSSANELNLQTIDGYVPSSLPTDAFAVNNIVLTGSLPPAFLYDNQTDYMVTGEILDGKTRVCVALVDPESSETVFCDLTDVADDGTFTHAFRFPSSLSGSFFLGVISGDGGAEGQASRRILISPPIDRSLRPTAVAAIPGVERIDYFQDNRLNGSESFSPDGASLEFLWMQVSGPPAVIADPTSAETTFFVRPDDGIERVAFQLVVSDGQLSSFPDQIEFRLRDTFFVTEIGMTDTACFSLEECLNQVTLPPPVVALDSPVIQGWVQLVNLEAGDLLQVTVTTPLGAVVLTGEALVDEDAPALSFWRFLWQSAGLEIVPGSWTFALQRNGQVEASLPFRVVTSRN